MTETETFQLMIDKDQTILHVSPAVLALLGIIDFDCRKQ